MICDNEGRVSRTKEPRSQTGVLHYNSGVERDATHLIADSSDQRTESRYVEFGFAKPAFASRSAWIWGLWMSTTTETYASISPRKDRSSHRTNSPMRNLKTKTRAESRVKESGPGF